MLRCSLTYQKLALTPQILIVHRTPSDRTPNATQSGGGRNLIGRRTQNDDLLRKKSGYYYASFPKPTLFFPPFNAKRIFPAHDTNNPTNSLRKDGSPPSSSHVCRCSGDKRPSPYCTRPLLSARRPAIARPASYPKGACPKRRHNACRRMAERICCLP